MNLLNYLNTSSIGLGLWNKFLCLGILYTLIFFGPVKSQTFNTPGSFTFTVPNYSGSLNPGDLVIVDVDIIIVGAGGGGGRGNGAGGGGGGRVIQMTITASEGDVLTGTIGSGGPGGTNPDEQGSDVTASSFAGTTAQGGMGGGGGNSGAGGDSGSGETGGAGVNQSGRSAGGGGAGAGGQGTDGVATTNPIGGNGGIGIAGFGGGGGGTATRPGGGGSATPGTATDQGTPGSTIAEFDATDGGGGGGGRTAGGDGGDGVVIVTINFRVLPVEFLYFRSDFNSTLRSGKLTWSTSKEWENSHFEVQRSVNDVKSWEKIAEVEGVGYSDQPVEYTYQDLKLPLSGGNIFYRLKQVDQTGKFIFSDTQAIQVKQIKGSASWRVYPNPTSGESINLEMLGTASVSDEKLRVRLISPTGQIDIIETTRSIQLNSELSEILKRKIGGIYTLEVNWGENREYHKLILAR